jgi:DNA gyrase subunit B
LAFLNSGVRISIIDARETPHVEVDFYYEGGVKEYVEYIDRSKTSLHPTIYFKALDEKAGITVEVALGWNDSYHENLLCFTE